MVGLQIKNGFIDFAKIDFKCPSCGKKYNDLDGKYVDRCNNNKNGFTKINSQNSEIEKLYFPQKAPNQNLQAAAKPLL